MFIVQPSSSFGDLICEELISEEAGHPRWHTFEFAVAWVNRAGAEKIKELAREFLLKGGCMRATVGLDFGSTTYEGLGSLLDLEDGGADITIHVFCDENPACTFHPKVFLFANAEQARLLVGSNNMTGAGLDTNLEAALGLSSAADNEAIQAARQALADWRDDEHDRRSRRLTRTFLDQLRDRRYVLTEEELRSRRNADGASRSSAGEPLFVRSTPPARRVGSSRGERPAREGPGSRSPSGEALLMRVLKRRNGNQIQISIPVLNSSFMNGATEVVLPDGSRRRIGANAARGSANTERFEAPGLKSMSKPVARFWWVDGARSGSGGERHLRFELFDASADGEGANILRKLKEGISTPPVTNFARLSRSTTVLSKSDPEHAQWYRLDSN